MKVYLYIFWSVPINKQRCMRCDGLFACVCAGPNQLGVHASKSFKESQRYNDMFKVMILKTFPRITLSLSVNSSVSSFIPFRLFVENFFTEGLVKLYNFNSNGLISSCCRCDGQKRDRTKEDKRETELRKNRGTE